MAQAVLGAWVLRDNADGAHLGSHGCGHCSACRDRLSAWCRQPTERGEIALMATVHADTEAELAAVACLSAIDRAGLDASSVVVVLLDGGLPDWLADAARRLTGGIVHSTADLKVPALRATLADRPTGRADAIVVRREVSGAVRAVRRGGVVCVGSLEPAMPSVTELVQREVRIVGPGGLSDRVLSVLPVAATATP